MHYAFLHGGGQGGWVWRETIDALTRQTAGDAHMLALDVPGCGAKRGRELGGISPDDVARELTADIEDAGLRDVVLVGHSLAGNVLPNMAMMRPDLFRRLVYVSCSIPLPGQTLLELMGTSLHGTNESEVGWPVPPTENIAESFPAMFCNDMGAAQAGEFLTKLGKDDWPPATYTNVDFAFEKPPGLPATFVFCLRDNILPMAWQKVFADRFAAERHVMIDAGHQAMTTRPEALAEILRIEAAIDV